MRKPGVVARYYLYRATTSYGFYLPVSTVYLTEVRGFDLGVVGAVQAAFTFALMAAEVPTGYVGDRVGRRASLGASSAVSVAVMAAYPVVATPLGYAAVNVLWAFGWGFKSGTGDAWLYELLAAEGRTGDFAAVSGRARAVLLATSAVGAVLAGLLATADWTLPFAANAALAALGLPVLFTLPAVQTDDGDGGPFGLREAVSVLRVQLARPDVRWLLAYVAVFGSLVHLARVFEQPAATAVGVPVGALGLLYAGFKVVSAGAAANVGELTDRLGVRGALLAVTPVAAVAYGSVALLPVAVVPVLFVNRVLMTVMRPVRNQYLNDRLADAGRATVLSGASMVISVVSGTAKLAGGAVATRTGPVAMLGGAGLLAAALGGLVWLATDPVRVTGDEPEDADPAAAPTD